MSREDFPINSRVKDEDGNKGTVIGHPLKSDDLAIEWDDGSLNKMSPEDLTLLPPGLEEDFQAISEAIKKAADGLNQATSLARKHGKDLQDLYYDNDVDVSELFRAISNAGWSSSSMRC